MSALQVRLLRELTVQDELGGKWDQLITENPATGIMQSLHWAAMKRRQGLRSVHFGIFDCGELCGGAIMYASRQAAGAGILVVPEGPVVPWDDGIKCGEYLRALSEACQAYSLQHGVIAWRVEPRLPPPPPAILREFGRAPLDLVPRETLYLDLNRDEDTLLSAMKPKGRYNIFLSERRGVIVTAHESADVVEEFYAAVSAASERDGFALESREFFEHLAHTLCAAGCATFFLAKHEGDLLGALLLVKHGNRATYLYGGTTDIKRNLMGGYALQWAAIKHARNSGCSVYDFYGYVPHHSPDHEYGRFSRFKSQFGGRAVKLMGAHEYFFLDTLADAFVKVAREAAR